MSTLKDLEWQIKMFKTIVTYGRVSPQKKKEFHKRMRQMVKAICDEHGIPNSAESIASLRSRTKLGEKSQRLFDDYNTWFEAL